MKKLDILTYNQLICMTLDKQSNKKNASYHIGYNDINKRGKQDKNFQKMSKANKNANHCKT